MLTIIGNEYKLLPNEEIILARKFGEIRYKQQFDRQYEGTIFVNQLDHTPTKDKNIYTLEEFLPKYLKKCFVPKDDSHNFKYEIKGYNWFEKIQKKGIDLFGLFWLFFFSWPVLIKCKYQIQKESPGPVIFTQPRVGINNKIFTCYKFRSMHINSHQDKYTRENDDRIFPWGNKMRKTRLDELPQMLNILKGDMHLIGPRAEWNILVQEYEEQLIHYSLRHKVAPGITGWAQVNYPYGANIEDARQKLMYDLYYIQYWSIWLEFKIVYKTMLTVVLKKGL